MRRRREGGEEKAEKVEGEKLLAAFVSGQGQSLFGARVRQMRLQGLFNRREGSVPGCLTGLNVRREREEVEEGWARKFVVLLWWRGGEAVDVLIERKACGTPVWAAATTAYR